jgi:PIN domain
MFIIFDTNVWLSELALNSPSGAAVRFYVQQHRATVVIPEVVRLELERNLTRMLGELAERIRSSHKQLLAVFGNLREVVLPTSDQIQEKVAEILSHIDVPTREIPFTLDAARSAFLKTIDRAPPSDKTQEFKDGVIWSNCIDLLAEADVYLITADKAFYSGRDYARGLADNLRTEAAACSHELRLMPDLTGLLESIRRDVQVDEQKLVNAFLQTHSDRIERMLERAGFTLEHPPEVAVRLYVTEVASQLYIEFSIRFQCLDSSGQERTDATLELRGDGTYDTSTGEYLELRSQGETLVYTNEEGQTKTENVVMMVGTAVLGHRSVQHTVRFPLS